MYRETTNGTLTVEKTGIGRRITEILYDQNSTPHAFSQRIKFGKTDTVYACLNDSRYINPKELQEMADVLGYSVDRLTQRDTEKSAFSFRVAVKSKLVTADTIELGKKLVKVAIGWSERVDYLNDLGSAYYYLDMVEEAHECYLDAFKYAAKLKDKFDDSERLFMVTSNLMITYTVKKDYWTLDHLLREVESAFVNADPKRAGNLAYSRAVIATERGDYELAYQKWSESLRLYEKTDDTKLIGKAYHNLAYFFFKCGRHEEAQGLFDKSIRLLGPYPDSVPVAWVNSTKNLIKLGETEAAVKLIEMALASYLSNEMKAQFQILYALASGNTTEAQKVLDLEDLSDNTKLIATVIAMDSMLLKNDSEQLMRYYKEVGKILKSKLPTWEEL